MKKILLFFFLACMAISATSITTSAQDQVMTPELLWKLGRVSFVSQSPDKESIIYRVTYIDISTEKSQSNYYLYNLKNKSVTEVSSLKEYSLVQWDNNGLYATYADGLYISKDNGKTFSLLMKDLKDAYEFKISPNGQYLVYAKRVLLETIMGAEKYPDASKSTAKIYTDLNYRHWDTYHDGYFNHIFLVDLNNQNTP